MAQAALYPALAISGNINTAATSIGSLGDAITGSLFAGLTQAIFNGGRLRSQVRNARALADQSYAAYQGTVLLALEDVENAIVALNTARAGAAIRHPARRRAQLGDFGAQPVSLGPDRLHHPVATGGGVPERAERAGSGPLRRRDRAGRAVRRAGRRLGRHDHPEAPPRLATTPDNR